MWLREALLHGAALSAAMTAVILASVRHDCEAWLNDYPPAIRRAFGRDKSPRARAHGRAWALVALAVLIAVHASLFHRLAALESPLSFQTAWAAAYVCFMTFNLVDLVVIDLGVMLGLRPRWAVLPGTDPGHPAYRDPWHHVRAFAIGSVGGVAFAAIAAAIGWLALG
jgi:hypothetical protein